MDPLRKELKAHVAKVTKHPYRHKYFECIIECKDTPAFYTMLRFSTAKRDKCGKGCTCKGRQLDIVQISTHPEHQKKGIATSVTTLLHSFAKANNLSLYIEQCITKDSKAWVNRMRDKKILDGKWICDSFYVPCDQVVSIQDSLPTSCCVVVKPDKRFAKLSVMLNTAL